ncbi:hypothetical protein PV325_007895, partial [Microctonus aethiopoides]
RLYEMGSLENSLTPVPLLHLWERSDQLEWLSFDPSSLQRELQRARQEAREAQLARGNYQDEMADLAETVEMATLDKEMAEEKAETLQIELEQLKEKLEEMTLDLEILRTEMSERSGGNGVSSESAASTYEMKQLEQQNNRLRETLVKMRDLSAHEKHEFQKLQKDLDQKKSEILELGRTKEKLSTRVEEMEHQISDLQEQARAEEMVEMLGEKKMALEERVTELEEAVADLEALQDMSDQLAESSKELELELREELDLALRSARDAHRHRDAALETLTDRELTITKFRELTSQLQEQCVQLQTRVQSTELTQLNTRGADQQLAEILDFQKTFAETRAQTKAVDLELRRLDAEEAQSHVRLLLSFMPPAFLSRGGDHDAIMTLLLIPRMIQKTEILISQVREKYRSIEKIDRCTLVKGHSIAQYAFRSRLCGHMHALQTALGCFESSLNVCSPEMLLKVGGAYPEMAAQEKTLDSLIQLAKKDQLDENIPMEGIEKCCGYFFTIFTVLFGDNSLTNQARMVVNSTRTLGSICDAITTEATAIKILIDGDDEDIRNSILSLRILTFAININSRNINSDTRLCQHIETSCEVIQQHLNSARRRVPRDQMARLSVRMNLGFDKDWPDQFINCYQNAVKVAKTLQDLLKSTLQTIIANGDLESGLNGHKVREMAAISSEKIYDTDDLGPVATLKTSLSIVQQMAANLAQKMAECENELAIAGQNTVNQQSIDDDSNEIISPIQLRAHSIRKESEETKILARKLEARDADIREARLALREKQEELSEMILRKELAEKRLATQQHDHELNVDKLRRKLEEAQNHLKRKEKEFEETMDHLQTDIDSLESERGQLKEKLKALGKKATTPIAGMPSSILDSTSNISDSNGSMIAGTPIGFDNRLVAQEITALKEALINENRLKRKLLLKSLKNELDSLEPLPVMPSISSLDFNIEILHKKHQQLVKVDIQNVIIYPLVPDLTRETKLIERDSVAFEKTTPAYKMVKRQFIMKDLIQRTEQLTNEVCQAQVRRTMGGMTPTNFAVFPSREMASAMREKSGIVAAQINIPYGGPTRVQAVNVGTEDLKKFHTLLCY